jgi:hypothetical protein
MLLSEIDLIGACEVGYLDVEVTDLESSNVYIHALLFMFIA